MGHHDNDFDAQRSQREDAEERRQKLRDETGGADDLGSQDERRKEGDNQH